MSGLALILKGKGFRVSGSDIRESERTEKLKQAGIDISIGHAKGQVWGADLVIFNTDVPEDNVELVAAKESNIEIVHRSELLAAVLHSGLGIAVTGTHGKTTTTSMLGLVLEQAGLDPTVVVGGEVDAFGGTGKAGQGRYVVAEACESDGTFLKYHPHVAVLTNIEPEHLDHYEGDFSRVLEAFKSFIGHVDEHGLVVYCYDDEKLRELVKDSQTETISYGFSEHAWYRAIDIEFIDGGSVFDVYAGDTLLGEVSLPVPGKHNISNALASIAVGMYLGISFKVIAEALRAFRNAKRRFQVIGQEQGVLVVDDYAHHPTEIKATISAARNQTKNKVVAVFQPQRYVRTQLLMNEFSQSFGEADEVILTEIYSPAGEKPIPGVSSEVLAQMIRDREGLPVHLFGTKEEIVQYLLEIVNEGDIVLTMGAGDIWKVAKDLVKELEETHKVS